MSKPKFQNLPRVNKGALVAAAKAQLDAKGTAPYDGEPGNAQRLREKLEEKRAQAQSGEAARIVEVQRQGDEIAKQMEGRGQEGSTGTPTPEAKPAPAPAAPKDEPLLTLGKRYAPKSERNTETWGKITTALKEGPKTLAQLAEVVKPHNDFIGYMKRGGHIVPYVNEANLRNELPAR